LERRREFGAGGRGASGCPPVRVNRRRRVEPPVVIRENLDWVDPDRERGTIVEATGRSTRGEHKGKKTGRRKFVIVVLFS